MDPVFHVLFPLLLLLAFRIDTKKTIFLLPFSIILDIDTFIPQHRMLLHNFIVAFIIPIVFIVWCYYRKKEWFLHALIIQFYLCAHIVLDLADGIGFLYPIASDIYFLKLNLYWHYFGPLPLPMLDIKYGIYKAIPIPAKVIVAEYPTASEISFSIFFAILIMLAIFVRNTEKMCRNVIVYLRKKIRMIYAFLKK